MFPFKRFCAVRLWCCWRKAQSDRVTADTELLEFWSVHLTGRGLVPERCSSVCTPESSCTHTAGVWRWLNPDSSSPTIGGEILLAPLIGGDVWYRLSGTVRALQIRSEASWTDHRLVSSRNTENLPALFFLQVRTPGPEWIIWGDVFHYYYIQTCIRTNVLKQCAYVFIHFHAHFWMKFSACVKRPDDYISRRYATTIRGGYQEQLTELLSCSKRWSDQIIASFIVVVISIIIIFPFFGLLSFYNKWISPEINTVLSYYNTIINLLLSQWCYLERWMCLNESKLTVIIQIQPSHLLRLVLSFFLLRTVFVSLPFLRSVTAAQSLSIMFMMFMSLSHLRSAWQNMTLNSHCSSLASSSLGS